MRRANERRMSISPPCAAAVGRAVAAALMRLLYSHRAKNGVECLRVGDEQEESVEAFGRLLEEELRLHAQDRGFDSRRMVTQSAQRDSRLSSGEARRGKHQPHVEKFAEGSEIGAGQNISSLVERGLLQLPEIGGGAALPPQHALGESEAGGNGKQENGLAGQVAR